VKLHEERLAMPLVVTSEAGANGDGYGALLALDDDGKPVGVFGEDRRIVDPGGLAVDQKQELLFLNGIDRVVALETAGRVVRDTGVINGLNPGLDWRGLKCCLRGRRLS
jgi:hypothetical protein